MSTTKSLKTRLLLSHLTVVGAVLTLVLVTVRFLTPSLFQRRVQVRLGGSGGPGAGGQGAGVSAQIQDAHREALNIALIVAAVVGLLLAVALTTWLMTRMLRSLKEMAAATNRLAAGRYTDPVIPPDEIELAELASSINQLSAELAATEQSRATLVSDLAHEIRNPLSTIEGYMEGLIDGVLPGDTATYTTVAKEAHRLQRLTKDLSLLAQAQEGALHLHIGPIDLGDLVVDVATRLGQQFESKGVDLDTRMTTPLIVKGDADRLTQALTNIIGNALAYTPTGGRVSVAGMRTAGNCMIEVADTGPGLTPDEANIVFQRFTRLDPESTGTGIGLNIARTIARLHYGDVTVSSQGHGLGTSFTIWIPASDGQG